MILLINRHPDSLDASIVQHPAVDRAPAAAVQHAVQILGDVLSGVVDVAVGAAETVVGIVLLDADRPVAFEFVNNVLLGGVDLMSYVILLGHCQY